ncbi:hypothetical protein LEMLEM_LOCUS15329 [Lemmus lemmus]
MRGLPAGSPILLLALPLASAFFALRHLAEDERSTLNPLDDGDARQVWSTGLEKSLSPEGKASCRVAWGGGGGVVCSLRRAAWTRSPGASAPSGMTRGCSSVPGPAAAGSGLASLRWRLSCALRARRRLDAGASFAPSPRHPPPSSPPHPHPEAQTRQREEPELGARGSTPFFWRPGLAGGGQAQRLPATPDRGRWKLR